MKGKRFTAVLAACSTTTSAGILPAWRRPREGQTLSLTYGTAGDGGLGPDHIDLFQTLGG
jgi:hypothetical protein